MTTPDPGGLTPGTWGVTGTDGSVPAKSTHNQTNIQTNLQDSFSSAQFGGLGGALIAMILSFIGGAIGAILGGFASVIDAIFGTVDDDYVSAMPSQVATTVAVSSLGNRVTILEGGIQVAEFNNNGTWTKPPGMKSHRVVLVAGGGGGRRPSAGTGDAIPGGYGGGQGGLVNYVYSDSDLTSTVGVLIGAGGAGATTDNTSGHAGNATSLGSYISAGAGFGGVGAEPQAGAGTQPEWQANGGHGQGAAAPTNVATAGGNGFLCIGGIPGTSGGPGSAGNSPPAGYRGVGSGGGGGARSTGGGGAGGAGGFPGGGGGGGGTFSLGGSVGSGGNGANGRAWIVSYPTDIREG